MSGVDIALAQAALGREVLPFRLVKGAGGKLLKKPLTRWQGANGATTDADIIRGWWKLWPTAMPGWRLPKGLLIADIDDQAAFDATGLELPHAPSQRTPSGGTHFLYSHDGARQTVKEVNGLDTRVGGSGWCGLYQVDSFAGDPPPAPAWLTMPRSSEPRDFAELGTRSEIASWLGSLARAGQLTKSECLALLETAYADGRIVDLDPGDPWPRAFNDLAAAAADWSRHDAPFVVFHRRAKAQGYWTPGSSR